ncbi:MAG: antitoxin Xre/MbcA/ParS toxin-binding domain-containing protein [Betaproteobacteria bacterium]
MALTSVKTGRRAQKIKSGMAQAEVSSRSTTNKTSIRSRVPMKSTVYAKGSTLQRLSAKEDMDLIHYYPSVGVDDYARRLARATPLQLVEVERRGVGGSFIKDLAKRMDIPSSRIYKILGLPKATAEKKAAAGEPVSGRGGQAAIGMVKLLSIAQEMVANSTASQTPAFDAAKWLGQWIERPQPALAGRKPAELLDTPTGAEVVARLLGSIESGAYQ